MTAYHDDDRVRALRVRDRVLRLLATGASFTVRELRDQAMSEGADRRARELRADGYPIQVERRDGVWVYRMARKEES